MQCVVDVEMEVAGLGARGDEQNVDIFMLIDSLKNS
jgi:hypothetical protein